jgi:hypothetical protein
LGHHPAYGGAAIDRRNEEDVVSGADATVWPYIPIKKAIDLWWEFWRKCLIDRMGDFVIVKQVVGVDVLSGHDVRQRPADSAAILDDHLMCRDVGNGDFVSRANRLEHPNVFAEDVDVVVGVQVADRNRNAVFWAEENGITHSALGDRMMGGGKSTIGTSMFFSIKSEKIL